MIHPSCRGFCALLLACAAGCSPNDPERPPARTQVREVAPARDLPSSSDDYQIRLWANQVSQGISDPTAIRRLVAAGRVATPVLLDLVARAAPRERARLLPVLVEIKDLRSVPVLIDLLSSETPEIHAALRTITGKDPGPRKSDWHAWWRSAGGEIAPEERESARKAFLAESPASQQEILRTLVRELSTPSLVMHRDPMGKETGREPRRIDTTEPADVGKRQAALAILEALLDQGDGGNLIYVAPLARQIGAAAVPALNRGLASSNPASRQAATKALSDLASPE